MAEWGWGVERAENTGVIGFIEVSLGLGQYIEANPPKQPVLAHSVKRVRDDVYPER